MPEDEKSFEEFLVEEACTNVAEELDDQDAGEDCEELMIELAEGDIDPDNLSEEAQERLGDGAFDAIQETWKDLEDEFT